MFAKTEDRVKEGLAGYPDDPSRLADAEAAEGFAQLQRISELVEAKRLRWLGDQDRRASWRADGYLSSAAWLADRFRVSHGAAKGQVKVAQALEAMPEVREAFAAGEVSSSAVQVLAEARGEHPGAFSTQERSLVEAAATRSVGELRRVVAEWSLAVDAEEALRRAERLRDRRRLDVCPTVTGMVRVEGELDPESGEALATALQAIVDSDVRAGREGTCAPPPSAGPTPWASWPGGTWTPRSDPPWEASAPT
jgi:hypothetical protein